VLLPRQPGVPVKSPSHLDPSLRLTSKTKSQWGYWTRTVWENRTVTAKCRWAKPSLPPQCWKSPLPLYLGGIRCTDEMPCVWSAAAGGRRTPSPSPRAEAHRAGPDGGGRRHSVTAASRGSRPGAGTKLGRPEHGRWRQPDPRGASTDNPKATTGFLWTNGWLRLANLAIMINARVMLRVRGEMPAKNTNTIRTGLYP
jgi:hypothetical protein